MQWQAYLKKSNQPGSSAQMGLNKYPWSLKQRSTLDPPALNPNIEMFRKAVHYEVMNKHFDRQHRCNFNISKKEQEALKELKASDKIIIKKADKGGGIVVMDKHKYLEEAYRQLGDTDTYSKLSTDPTESLKTLISSVLEDAVLEGIINPSTKKVLETQNPRVPVLYLLPKIHKDLTNPPGRPIVSGTGSVLQTLAIYLDQFLKPIVNRLPRCLKDTKDFLVQLNKLDFKDVTLLGSFDVTSLYTNIPHDEGLCSIKEEIMKNALLTNQEIGFLMTLFELVLSKNYFRFEHDFYLQTQGVAMGSSIAPNLANIYMSHFEQNKILAVEEHSKHLKCWYRFVDDVFFAWTGTELQLKEFLAYINTVHRTIKFTLEYHPTEQRFLDVMVTLKEGHIHTNIYKKSTDIDNTIPQHSHHPPGVFKGVVTGHLTRIKRITSDPEVQKKVEQEALEGYKAHGYPENLLKAATKAVESKTRDDLLAPKQYEKTQKFIFKSQYGQHTNLVKNCMRKYWGLITADPSLRGVFPEPPTVISSRGRSIGDIIIRSDVAPPKKPQTTQTLLGTRKQGTFPCLKCSCCSTVIKGAELPHPTKKQPISIKDYHTCDSTGVIYLLKCPCGLAYVGQTTRAVRTRITEHRSVIRSFLANPNKKIGEKTKETGVARHFVEKNHKISELRWQVIEKVYGESNKEALKSKLLRREVFWIHRLETMQPNGMNEECRYSLA